VVHLITGGIDFLTLAHDRNLKQMTPAERDALWTDVAEHVQIIVDACLAVRPGILMAIADYDYLDLPALERFAGANYFYGATVTEFNGWMVELGRKKLEVARKTDRCEYVQNWGLLQYHLGDPPKAVPLPGAAPDYSPYPGGDCTLPMPAGIAPDGIHPNEKAHTLMVQNAVDRYYREWLAPDAG
ncbi:MAG: hydrolase family protein, partial [Candidatus Hydrogenedentes bacterium]|nr:hydrolase family protein [Candidatus Hydrogenedentota bacterium]